VRWAPLEPIQFHGVAVLIEPESVKYVLDQLCKHAGVQVLFAHKTAVTPSKRVLRVHAGLRRARTPRGASASIRRAASSFSRPRVEALSGLADAYSAEVPQHQAFLAVLDRDAKDSLAAIEMVLRSRR